MEPYGEPIMVTRSFLPPLAEYVNQISTLWDSHWITNNGKIHNKFSHRLQSYLGVDDLSLLVNGHMALEIAIKSMGLTGEIITTPFTFASTAHAITNCGITPVFCDISRDDFNMDVELLPQLITSRTTAIIPVHVFGTPCNVQEIQRVANEYGLKVIYDAAHAFGVQVDGVGIGTFGDASMFSLHATKVFHSIEGGIITYSKSEIGKNVELIKNFGISGPETVEVVGTNAKMNEFSAAMGLVNLDHIEKEIEERTRIYDRYCMKLSEVPGISILQKQPKVLHNHAYFPVIIHPETYGMNRDLLHEELARYNVFTRKYFYPLITDYPCYKNLSLYEMPNASFVAERVLTLPIYSSLSNDMVDYICELLKYLHFNQTSRDI